MRFICVILLVFLLIAGPAAAMAVGSGSVASPIKNVQTVKTEIPVSQKIVVGAVPMYITTQAYTAVVNFDSVPEGATITIDGWGLLKKTPNTWSLDPGSHTIVLTLAGYPDYTTTVTLPPIVLRTSVKILSRP